MSSIAGTWPPSLRSSRVNATGLTDVPTGGPAAPRLLFDADHASAAVLGQLRLVGDLRVFDPESLRRRLRLPSDDSRSDAELFLTAFRRWRFDCFAAIDGDFAVAIWDSANGDLTLARDALGERPLHYQTSDGGIAFASLPMDAASFNGPPRPDFARLVCYLTDISADPQSSFIRDVRRVRPGHFVVAKMNGTTSEVAWWKPDLSPLRIDRHDAVNAVSTELHQVLTGMVRSDAPIVAADLSGGLDSSLVVTAAARAMDERKRLLALSAVATGGADRPPHWFIDESERAAETARINGVGFQAVSSAPRSPLRALDRWLPFSQEPVANACNLGWLDSCYEAAVSAGAKVYLTGGWGNLTLSRPGLGRFPELAGSLRLIELGRELNAYRKFVGGSWPGLLASSFGPLFAPAVWDAILRLSLQRKNARVIRSETLLSEQAISAARASGSGSGQEESARLYADERPAARLAMLQSAGDDGNGNHAVRRLHGIEIREPLGARSLVELCMRLPGEVYLHRGKPRALARDLLRGHAPSQVIDERRRGWQGANWRAAFEPARAEMRAEIDRIDDDPELGQVMDAGAIRAMLDSWPGGNWNDWAQIETYRNTLFRAIGAARFARFVREWTPG